MFTDNSVMSLKPQVTTLIKHHVNQSSNIFLQTSWLTRLQQAVRRVDTHDITTTCITADIVNALIVFTDTQQHCITRTQQYMLDFTNVEFVARLENDFIRINIVGILLPTPWLDCLLHYSG